jgi:phosphoesterase RecJ-like protein
MMQFEDILQGVKTVALAGHVHPDGDSVGSCIGLWHYLRDNFPHIETDILLEQPAEKFAVLEGFEQIGSTALRAGAYDLFISLDCAAIDRLGDAQPHFEKAGKTLCIDHHISNSGFAEYNVILPEASSTCEVLCELMDAEKISRGAAAALYTGIAHDTGVFQYSCTSPKTMRLAAMLMEKDIPYPMLLEETFYKKTYSQNQILGKALLESMRILEGRCIVSVVRRKEMDFFGVSDKDLEGIVSQMKLTEGVEVAIFMHETGNMEYKVSMRSRETVDVSRVASYFGGGGHVRAAGVTMKGTFHDIINNLTLHIENQLKGQEV